MKYRSVIATRTGPPEVLQVIENDLRPPAAGEVRIKVLAASVCRPDITVRTGGALYSGTPLGQKVPFVPSYSVIGVVDAVGAKAKSNRSLPRSFPSWKRLKPIPCWKAGR